MPTPDDMERVCKAIAQTIRDVLPDGARFGILVLEARGRHATFHSNMRRESVITALRELLTKLEGT